MTIRWVRWLSLLCLLPALACTESPAGDGPQQGGAKTLTCPKDLDCSAKAAVRDLATGMTHPPSKPLLVQAGGLEVGAHVDVALDLVNAAAPLTALPLRVTAVRLEPKGAAETKLPAFTCQLADTGADCATLAQAPVELLPPSLVPQWPGTQARLGLRLRYTHHDTQQRTVRLCLDLKGDLTHQPSLCLQAETRPGVPKLLVQPELVDFGYVTGSKTVQAQLTNVGDAPLPLKSVRLQGDGVFQAKLDGMTILPGDHHVLDKPAVLQPGDSKVMGLTCAATDSVKRVAALTLEFAHPAVPPRVVPLWCNAAVPCLKAQPEDGVAFGAVLLGEAATRDVALVNCGSGAVEIQGLTLLPGSHPAFGLDPGPLPQASTPTAVSPLTLDVNQKATLRLVYQPAVASPTAPGALLPTPDTALLQVTTNALPLQVPLSGVAVTSPCPVAHIALNPGDEVVPQTTVTLDGSGSTGTDGLPATGHAWTIAKAPKGAQVKLLPNAKAAKPKVKLDAAGDYQVCLQVTDAAGKASCVQTCRTIHVVPEACLHVELLWSTPGDTQPNDEGPGAGADLDLHFAHPKAVGPDLDCDGVGDPWYSNPFDVYWSNPQPNWGNVAAGVQDDPSLDLDDTDGHGPENLSLAKPEGSLANPVAYRIGVHYWNDYGYGPSLATVRAFACGVLAFEAADVELQPLDLWTVGQVNWPNAATGAGAQPFVQPCWQSGDACLAKKDPANPAGGKPWQPQGQRCVTPCYVHPLTPPGAAPVCQK